ncbi:hypothetical protein CP960_07475 [Malaciobacter halophilus]|uniref:histidine kinase n=1 Tax=Malaciobacter halophilus TaxID=197482 RepID=A0A2N1J2Q0_9BACT|nr:ATP-binding protein [Malaciobacter halophilus]AXH09840.1 signal transduction sensor histidine kinase [Malaciobacter halophilus]PKI80835.1 hypothetical protein CP960_07475 [Malaciobacter halophilus]
MIKKLLLLFFVCNSFLYSKNILILNSYHPSFSWTKKQVDGIVNTLTSSKKDIDIYIEYMDTKRNNPTLMYKYKFLTLLKYKYINKKIDLVISTDDTALNFLKMFRDKIFTDSKIVFSGVNNLNILEDYTKNDITGVFERMTPIVNYELAKKINPNLKKLYLIGDDSVTFEVLKKLVLKELDRTKIDYEFLSYKSIDKLTSRLKQLDDDSMAMLIMTARYVDKNNNPISMESALKKISDAYKKPIISTAKVFNRGGKIIGGYVVDGNRQGVLAAKLALRVLENPTLNIKPILNGTNSYVFDYNALRFFGIDIKKHLPSLSIDIANKPISFFEHFKQTIIIIFIIALSLIVILLISLFYNFRLKKVNKRLEESNKNIQIFIDNILEGIIISKDSICIDLNKEAVKLLGYKKKNELINKNILEFLPKNQHDFLNSENAGEAVFIKKNKERINVLAMNKEVTFEDMKVNVTSFVDLTHSKKREKVLFEQSKLASMGEMIGNIAHQWRQPLSAISTSASGLKLQYEVKVMDDEMFHKSIDNILKSTNYLSNTIDDFKNYIKGDKVVTKFDVSHAIDNSIELLSATFKNHGINIVKNFDKIEIYSCFNELIQVLINILNNSKDALNKNCKDEKVIFITIKDEKDTVIIEITDNALGAKDKILPKIFEPYFTTKSQSQGTGLGLYMSHNIVTESLKGTIFASNKEFIYNSKDAKGLCMQITLPKYIEIKDEN